MSLSGHVKSLLHVDEASTIGQSISDHQEADPAKEIMVRQHQIVAMIAAEQGRLKLASSPIRTEIEAHIGWLEHRLITLNQQLQSLCVPAEKFQEQLLGDQPQYPANLLSVEQKHQGIHEMHTSVIMKPPTQGKNLTKPKSSLAVPKQGTLASGLKNYWYVAEFSANVGKSTLKPFKLFGEAWLLFRNQDGQVGCIKDECAHRACPLSLGQWVEGNVQCGYHGWTYGIDGNCSHIPSCQQPQALASIQTWPCFEADGLIWVWPGDETPNEAPSRVQSIPAGFQLHAELIMDLPVEHGLLMENLLDLAHAPFTHTGTFAKGWPVPEMVRFLTPSKTPLWGHWDPYPIEMSFEPPCYVVSTIGLRGKDCGKHLHQLHCCLPAEAGKTRLLYRLALDFWGWARFLPGKDRFWQRMAQRVINEDLRLVMGQQQQISTGGDVWNMPVAYDKLGVRYRRWRNQVEKNSPEWPAISSQVDP
ncbi:MAG: Rieske 2Fe-2S domain-containing protein [Cyanothece sp. SIO1E1]|nr:Rieske 2Fe-2S domain-containing protein [Cyanothece sp. SIO1E1]